MMIGNAAWIVALIVVGSAALTGVILGLSYLVWLALGTHP